MRGKLKDLIEMPMDVLFEIFAQMDPLDLLNLSRTSKDLHAMLRSRTSKSIWKSARSNFLPPVPECPDDLSEPAYAELLFAKGCHYCQRNVTVNYAWAIRKRICSKCLPDRCRQVESWRSSHILHGAEIPVFSIAIKSGRQQRVEKYYLIELREACDAEYKEITTPEQRKEWVNDKIELKKKRYAHADLCMRWSDDYQDIQKVELLGLVTKQQALISEHVKSLGWADEVSKMSDSYLRFEQQADIIKLCKKEFNERTISSLDFKINAFMNDIKAKRLEKAQLVSLKSHLPVFKETHAKLMATIPDAYTKPYPTVGELIVEPTILDILMNTPEDVVLTPDDLMSTISALFPDATERLRRRLNGHLVKYLRDAYPTQDVTEESGIFDLATTVFECSYCGSQRGSFWYEDITAHWCYGSGRYEPEIEATKQIVDFIFNMFKYRQLAERISVDTTCAQIITTIIKICGLDPLTTTKQMMDEADHIFECVGCNSQEDGRAIMSWSGLAFHYHRSHRNSIKGVGSMDLKLVTGDEADTARKRIEEQKARALAANTPCLLACAHCGDPSHVPYHGDHTKSKHINHIEISHGITKVTNKDFILRYDAKNWAPYIFRMWPPRPE